MSQEGTVPSSHQRRNVMSARVRHLILRAHALYLGLASVMGFLLLDVRGVVFGTGPLGRLLEAAPYSAIGMVEAHGLACILAVTFWRATPLLAWHLTGAATALLLGIANLVFWEIFPASDAIGIGYVTTGLHWLVGTTQLAAAVAVLAGAPAPADVRTVGVVTEAGR
jgi:hypothetical protein